MNNIQTLEHPTMNGLKSLTLDDLTTDIMNASDLNADHIDGNYFSIDTIEANDIQVDAELHFTNNGFIIVGKNTPSEVIVTDDEVKHLANMRSNIQAQIDLIDNDTSGLAINVAQNTADIDANRLDIGTNTTNITINTGNISSNLSLININTGNISSNLSLINTNTGNISSNLSLININTGNISSNNIRTSSNLAAINVNAGRIFDNFTDINTNANDIITNANGINTNANDIISTNNTLNLLEVDVGLNINAISDLESSVQELTAPKINIQMVPLNGSDLVNMLFFTNGTTYNTNNVFNILEHSSFSSLSLLSGVWHAGPKCVIVKYSIAFKGLSSRIVIFKSRLSHDSGGIVNSEYQGAEFTGNGTPLYDVFYYNDSMIIDMIDYAHIKLHTWFDLETASSGSVECTGKISITEI
jgi:hypothetical protein